MIRRPPRSTQGVSSAASDVYKRQRETRETRTRFKYYCDVVIDDEDDDDDADTNIIHSAKENNDGGKFRAQNARKRRRERRTQNDVLFVF